MNTRIQSLIRSAQNNLRAFFNHPVYRRVRSTTVAYAEITYYYIHLIIRFFWRLTKTVGRIVFWPVRTSLRFIRRIFGRFEYRAPRWWYAVRARLQDELSIMQRDLRPLVKQLEEFLYRRQQSIVFGMVVLLAFGSLVGSVISWLPDTREAYVSVSSPSESGHAAARGPDTLRLQFRAEDDSYVSVAPIEHAGDYVRAGIQLEPSLPGVWFWQGDSTLVFRPDQPWPLDQEFTVSLDESVIRPDMELAEDTITFDGPRFYAQIDELQYYIDPVNPDEKRITATIHFSHAINEVNARRFIELQCGFNDVVPIELFFKNNENAILVRSEIIPIPDENRECTLSLDAGLDTAFESEFKLRNAVVSELNIPGRDEYFQMESVETGIVENRLKQPERVLVFKARGAARPVSFTGAIEAYVLPLDRPAYAGQPALPEHAWSLDEMDDYILSQSEKITLEPVAQDNYATDQLSYRLHAPAGRRLYIHIPEGAPSETGYRLAKSYSGIFTVPEFPSNLFIMHEGSVLSLSGEKKLTVAAHDLGAVEISVERVLPDDINHLVSQSDGEFQNVAFYGHFNSRDISERFREVRYLQKKDPGEMQYFAVDFQRYVNQIGRTGLFFLTVREWDSEKETATDVSDRRFILVTDLGFVVKEAVDGTRDVFVQSIRYGVPVAGVEVRILGRNGLALTRAVTDGSGKARIPVLKDFQREQQPVAYVLQYGNDISFMPFNRYDRQLGFSRFDVDGLVGQDQAGTLNAFLFSDRGIYRPGEEIRLASIVREAHWRSILTGVPVELVITDPRGLEIHSEKLRLSGDGFQEFQYQTRADSLTGAYAIALYTIKDENRDNRLGSTEVQVEEFLPDRMRLRASFSKPDTRGWVSPDNLKASVDLAYLFGAPAANHRVSATIRLTPGQFYFPGYTDYTFFDPAQAERGYEEPLESIVTDENGHGEFDAGVDRFGRATYSVLFTARGFEADGGRSVYAADRILVSPLQHLVGYKADGSLTYIPQYSRRILRFIAVDPELNLTAVSNLKYRIIEQSYHSDLVRAQDNTYRYQSVLREQEVDQGSFQIQSNGRAFVLNTSRPGDFELRLYNAEGDLLSKVFYRVAGAGNLTLSRDRDAEMEVVLNKHDYAPGESILLNVRAPYTGAGLITIERDKVYTHKWFIARTQSSVQSIQVPAGVEGNAYVSVTFIRSPDSPEIFSSPLSYNTQPFSISRAGRENQITLSVPEKMEPGQRIPIRFRTSRAGRIVVYAVDEGILQVGRYTTPDPLAYFFRKRALSVTTSQIVDLILPEYSVVRQVAAPGGGSDIDPASQVNPFKRRQQEPVAFWSGILNAGPGWQTVYYDVPAHFNGSLRVMAVAVSPQTVGSTMTGTRINHPYVLNPNAPLFAAPGDQFEATVSVVNTRQDIAQPVSLTVDLEVSGPANGVSELRKTIRLDAGAEQTVRFGLTALDEPGNVDLKFRVTDGVRSTQIPLSMSVRPTTIYTLQLKGGTLRNGSITTEVPTTELYEAFRTDEVSVAAVPLGAARGLGRYLIEYPYGCTEQLISGAFPALIFADQPELMVSGEASRATVQRALGIIRTRQNENGEIAYWTPGLYSESFFNVYAAHFVLEAQERGHAVPERMRALSLEGLNRQARGVIAGSGLADFRAAAYAVYVLTRSGLVTTNILTELRGELQEAHTEHDIEWEQDITAAFLAASHQLLKQSERADDLIDGLEFDPEWEAEQSGYYYTPEVHNALLAYVLALHFPDKRADLDARRLSTLAVPESFQTLSAALSILALDALADDPRLIAGLSVTAQMNDDRSVPLSMRGQLFPRSEFPDSTKSLLFNNSGNLLYFYQMTRAGFPVQPPRTDIEQGMQIYRDIRKDGQSTHHVRVGDELTVHLRARADDLTENVSIVDLLPGGLEPVLRQSPDQERDSEWREGGWRFPLGTMQSTLVPDHMDMREDRIILFTPVTDELREFVYKVRAVNAGKFQIPPVYAEAMYDRNLKAVSVNGDTLTIDPPDSHTQPATETARRNTVP